FIPIAGGVVARGMAAHPKRHAFDEGRAVARAGAIGGLAHGLVHGEHVVAVHAHAGHAVAFGLLDDLAHGGLALDRHRDGPLVVLADEDDRRPPDAREV